MSRCLDERHIGAISDALASAGPVDENADVSELLESVEARLRLLEERLAFVERHLEVQDKALWEADRERTHLQAQLEQLKGRLQALGNGDEGEARLSADERPPHY
ncbi:MAG: SlyX family protein [Opitutales bacterium]